MQRAQLGSDNGLVRTYCLTLSDAMVFAIAGCVRLQGRFIGTSHTPG